MKNLGYKCTWHHDKIKLCIKRCQFQIKKSEWIKTDKIVHGTVLKVYSTTTKDVY